ncbi:MAG: AAA family ATPase [Nitriliruptorales bacterium]
MQEKVRVGRPHLEGERRTVTVVFVDAVASTALAERLDEEDVYYLLQDALACMVEAVERYEGVVTQFLGDGIIALFGAPIAHEDAARRAMCAALDMRRALKANGLQAQQQYGEKLVFRIGLNTGPVVVGSVSDDLDMDFTAIGDTINLAARMQQHADAGQILVSEHTYGAVRDYFEFEDIGPQEVKGKAALVRAYRPLGQRPVHTRIQVAAEHGLTPFVGRDHELNLLEGLLEEARLGAGQVVFVAGEAGMGKSRLLLEFRRSLANDDVGWLEGRSISYGRSIPYLPMSELVQQSFGVKESDDEAGIIRRVEERTAAWDERARTLVPYLKNLLNVDQGDQSVARTDPRERQAAIFHALQTLLLIESRQRPLVVLVEDLHWVDESTEQALVALVDVVPTAPVLLVLTYRPGYSPSLGDRTYFSRITLRRLPQEETAAMARAVLQAEALPPELVQLVNSKAEGNPFYTEEVTKSLLESGVLRRLEGSFELAQPVDQLRLPDTIQEVVLSRIDRLQPAAREALQLASVIGREFTERLLARISDPESQLDEALNELKRLELVYQKEYFPDLSYMFKHALTHEVAYSTLLRERRRALHRLVGAAIEELYPERLAEQVETLAHHHAEGHAWDKALNYLVKAGDKAAVTYANNQALDYYEHALELWDRVSDETRAQALPRYELLDRAGKAAAISGEMMRALRHRQEAVAAAGDDVPREVRAGLLASLSREMWVAGQGEEALATLEEALREVPDEPSPERAAVFAKRSAILTSMSFYEDALEAGRQAIQVARAVGARSVEAHALNSVGGSTAQLGEIDRGVAYLREAQHLAKQVGDLEEVVRSYANLGHNLGSAGRFDDAIAVGLEGIAWAERKGVSSYLVGFDVIRANLLDALFWAGRWSEADEVVGSRSRNHPHWAAIHLELIAASLRVGQGRFDEARVHLWQGRELIRFLDDPCWLVPLHAVEAELAVWEQRWLDARSLLDQVPQQCNEQRWSDYLDLYLPLTVRTEAELAISSRANRDEYAATEARRRAEEVVAKAQDVVAKSGRHMQRADSRGSSFPVRPEEAMARGEAELRRLARDADPDTWGRAIESNNCPRIAHIEAYTRWRRAEALLHLAHRAEAAIELEQAHEIAMNLGARPLRQAISTLAHRAHIALHATAADDTGLA